ncbi:hypothetical protein BB559_003015 [Furculomyces boomerangus]|uniref:Micro-fibrillar-associated protein 1 C-terminal domain-containing protein n=1 Tax=Furculomyces boomerangus TaxID=61424 RepID=A0A2T9YPZ3_9FUNG|nr:hypothetical protein BB559_003015 [Furculomyces boomerangus]
MNRNRKFAPTKQVATSGSKVTRYYPGQGPETKRNYSDSESGSEVENEELRNVGRKESRGATNKLVNERVGRGGIEMVITENREAEQIRRQRLAARQRESDSSESEGLSSEKNIEENEESETSSSDEEDSKSRRERLELRQRVLQIRQQEEEGLENNTAVDNLSEGSSEESSGSSEYESEDSIIKMRRPVFVSKNERKTGITKMTHFTKVDIVDEEEIEEQYEERRKETLRMASMQVKEEFEVPDVEDLAETVDDTDGVDEEEEAERVKLSKGTGNHHMGAFFTDILDEKNVVHKYSATIGENNSSIKELPEILQAVRNKKFGRMSQTKWKGMGKEDTSKDSLWNEANPQKRPRNH